MRSSVRIVKDILQIVQKHFDSAPCRLEVTYYSCLNNAKAYCLKSLRQPVRISQADAIKIFNKYFAVIFRKSRKDCIPYSLSLHILLYCLGYGSIFLVGINRFPFSSHAWVEDLNGNILNSHNHLCKNRLIIIEKRLDANE